LAITHDPNCDSNEGYITNNTQTCAFVCFAVEVRQDMLEEAQRKLMNLLNTTEGKVDK